MLLLLFSCTHPDEKTDPCGNDGALSTCLKPVFSEDYYADQGSRYFDTLESDYSAEEGPLYNEMVARWEWPPWLLLTGFWRKDMETADALIRLIPTMVPTRDCRFFEESPFARCRVDFMYEDHPEGSCPIYEEFTFDDTGAISFIEAWSDQPEYLPAGTDDPWAEGSVVHRLSTRIPGLGVGSIALDSRWMEAAAAADPEVADFVSRTEDFYGKWLEAYSAAGDDVFAAGCGW